MHDVEATIIFDGSAGDGFEFARVGDNRRLSILRFSFIYLDSKDKRRLIYSDQRWPIARSYGLAAACSERASPHAADDERKKRLKEVNVSFCCYTLANRWPFLKFPYAIPSTRACGINLSTRFPSLLNPPLPVATPMYRRRVLIFKFRWTYRASERLVCRHPRTPE